MAILPGRVAELTSPTASSQRREPTRDWPSRQRQHSRPQSARGPRSRVSINDRLASHSATCAAQQQRVLPFNVNDDFRLARRTGNADPIRNGARRTGSRSTHIPNVPIEPCDQRSAERTESANLRHGSYAHACKNPAATSAQIFTARHAIVSVVRTFVSGRCGV